jgi:hypothetical protein
MLSTVSKPEVGSVGGEWAVIGLARSDYDVPDSYYSAYYKTVEQYVKEKKGILHTKKYTEYSRVILGLTAAGFDPTNIGGYDLTKPLEDFDKTIWQGINGPIWALIALDSGDYASTQRDHYLAEILRRQLSDGGWNLTADGTDPRESGNSDITGMALQALAGYQDRPEVKAATEKALAYLSQTQDEDAGYSYEGSAASESVVQVLVGITALGLNMDDPRFVKNGQTLVDNILSFKNADGSFNHTGSGEGNNQMATEQALYGLVAAQRARDGKSSLYSMSAGNNNNVIAPSTPGLTGKDADVHIVPITKPGQTFVDIIGHPNKNAIEQLAEREIITGTTDSTYAPNDTVTRAQFAAIVTRGLGLPQKTSASVVYADVPMNAWYRSAVATAADYGLVTGTPDNTFNPLGSITRQEASVMIARAAQLVGLNTVMNSAAIRDTLAQFGEYKTVPDWAASSLAFGYANGILDDAAFDIAPKTYVSRGEIAEMLYRLLAKAELLQP